MSADTINWFMKAVRVIRLPAPVGDHHSAASRSLEVSLTPHQVAEARQQVAAKDPPNAVLEA